MSVIDKALVRSNALRNTAYSKGLALKQGGLSGVFSAGQTGSFSDRILNQGGNKSRYALNKGWVYAAVNALATEAAGQPVRLARLRGSVTPTTIAGETHPRYLTKVDKTAWIREKMTKEVQRKSAGVELEMIHSHPLLEALETPNPIQHRWQFVHSFISNLALTGWAFVVGGKGEGGDLEFYSLPTTWVVPDHSKGAFSQFKIVNPRDPSSKDAVVLGRENVAFAYLPNPADPLVALSPSQAQGEAIKIDDNIQSSQRKFFENGIFPSVLVTVGANPHPEVPGGVRPRLTAKQRRQVYGAIRKTMAGVANYGNPAILDGLIEKIQRFSSTSNEMGWDRSEEKVRTRILAAFGVHPFILGEKMPGSYAQAWVIQDRFCQRVNTYLDLLSQVMTGLAAPHAASDAEDLLLWWEKAEANDPQLDQQIWRGARERGDISQNEYRSWMGLPPDEDKNENVIRSDALRPIIHVASEINQGVLTADQGTAILEGIGLPSDLAGRIAGPGKLSDDQIEILETLQEITAPPQIGSSNIGAPDPSLSDNISGEVSAGGQSQAEQ